MRVEAEVDPLGGFWPVVDGRRFWRLETENVVKPCRREAEQLGEVALPAGHSREKHTRTCDHHLTVVDGARVLLAGTKWPLVAPTR